MLGGESNCGESYHSKGFQDWATTLCPESADTYTLLCGRGEPGLRPPEGGVLTESLELGPSKALE